MSLLPDNERKFVKREYAKRRLIVVLLFTLILISLSAVAILPSFVFSRVRKQGLLLKVNSIKQSSQAKDGEELNKKIQEIRRKMSLINEQSQVSVYGMFEAIISEKGQSIRITGIDYSLVKEKPMVRVSGIAATRGALLEFSKKLEAEMLAFKVNLPVSNFAKDKNIEFTLEMNTK